MRLWVPNLQRRAESAREAHLLTVVRKATDEARKVGEVQFITSLEAENRKMALQQRLESGEQRRAERLEEIRRRQQEAEQEAAAAQERRRQLEAARSMRLEARQARPPLPACLPKEGECNDKRRRGRGKAAGVTH